MVGNLHLFKSWSHMVTRSCVAHWQVYFYPLEQDGILEGPASTYISVAFFVNQSTDVGEEWENFERAIDVAK